MPCKKKRKGYIHVVTRGEQPRVPTHLFLTKKEYSKLAKKSPKRFQKWRV